MNLHGWLHARLMPVFRRRRYAVFARAVALRDTDRVLDVGGYPSDLYHPIGRAEITCLNIDPDGPSAAPGGRFRCVRGDARQLPYPDGAFDVVFSNSVIEHVGSWEDQRRFASEVRRVAARLWVQTPNRGFPIEPHLVAPFVHFLPRRAQVFLARWATPWGWAHRPTAAQARAYLDDIRLLTYDDMRRLFPDCTILRERFLGLTKSLIAVRATASPPAKTPDVDRTPVVSQHPG